jgi:hypothetical protein
LPLDHWFLLLRSDSRKQLDVEKAAGTPKDRKTKGTRSQLSRFLDEVVQHITTESTATRILHPPAIRRPLDISNTHEWAPITHTSPDPDTRSSVMDPTGTTRINLTRRLSWSC